MAANFPVKGHGDYTIEDPPKAQWIAHHQLQEPKFADIIFQFDNKPVCAHSNVLMNRCTALYQLYEKETSGKKKKKKGIVNLKIPQPHQDYPISSDTFELVLQFLYADNIQFETLQARQALDLSIAAAVFDLPRLVRLCRDYVKESISLDNFHQLLKVSHDTNEERVRLYCVEFCSRNKRSFITNKDQVTNIGVELFQDVMETLMFTDSFDIEEKNPIPPPTLLPDFRKLYTDLDMGAIQGDSSVQFKGTEIQFHKSFFTAQSKSLGLSFQSVANGDEITTDIMKVKTILTNPEAFRAILKYLYYGDLSGLTCLYACEVQEFAKTHGMMELQIICEFIMAVNINVESVMSIMGVVFNAANIKRPDLAEVRSNTLTFFIQNIVKLDLDARGLLLNGPIVMAEIIMAWQASEQEKKGISPEQGYDNSAYDQSIDEGDTATEKEKKKKKKDKK